ncbi:MAG: NTP transferase domain-containing protein [Clostridiales bacterium]|jgi:mannose-1-phosphate guanylyltransferase/phosphomannomutase|nr:NTP transferase domain-containing protein [Clostridiales bacterium]
MKGLIMAGGEGTRLRPLTCGKPKPMINVMGKPVMEYIITLMKNAGITDIAVTLMYMPQAITEYFGDGGRFGVRLNYFIEETPLGTAGSVKNAEAFLDDTFLIISGDCLTDIDLRRAAEFHREKRSEATLVLTAVENPLEYGIVVTDKRGAVVRFLEKPSWSEVFSDTANTGIYILNPSALRYIPAGTPYDFSKDLYPKMLADGAAVYGCVAGGYWCDIGDLTAYRACHFDILDKKVNIDIGAEPRGGVYVCEHAEVARDAEVHAPCYIGDGAVIHSGAKLLPYSVIGGGSRIFGGASVKQAVLQKMVSVGKGAQIRGGVIADGAAIGARSLALEGSVIGEKTRIGDSCEVKNNIKIWPGKTIADETVVSGNLVWGGNFSKRLFGENGVTGEINADATPEFAARLGAAFGASGKHAGLSVSGASGGAADMLRGAFVSGLLSAGVRVYDLGGVTLPEARRGIPFYGLGGGAHLSATEADGETRLRITFLNPRGCDISRDAERKIETLFAREDFVRCEPSVIRGVTALSEYPLYYARELFNELNREGGLRLTVAVEGCDRLRELLTALGAEVSDGGRGIVTAKIDGTEERLALIDELGRTIAGEKYAALAALIAVKTGGKTVAAPVCGSAVTEKIAARYGAAVVRCKSGNAHRMDCMLRHNALQFRLMYDAVYAFARICVLLSAEGLRLCDVADEIPEVYMTEREVPCDAGKNGKVIRAIADHAQSGRIELEEGVKILRDGGWALILPHAEKPVCRVISEGQSAEFAAELCDIYIREVEKFAK